MATTTNYGWTTPDDTSLVKDGASAIRTLGTSADTTVKSLNPGTTAGDLDYYTAATTKARIGIGTNGQVLTSNGSVPAWATSSAGGMTLISTTTLSGATVTLSSIPQTHKDLVVIITGFTANTANNSLRILPNNVNNLAWQTGVRQNSGSAEQYSATVIYPHAFQNTLRTSSDNAMQVLIRNYSSTTGFKPYNTSHVIVGTDSNYYAGVFGGAFMSATAISSLVIDYGGTNTFAGGTVLLYGVS